MEAREIKIFDFHVKRTICAMLLKRVRKGLANWLIS